MSIKTTEIQNGDTAIFYSVVTTYIINGRQFMYGQSRTNNNRYFIQEISKSGKVVNAFTESGDRDHYYDFVSVLENNGNDNKSKFLYCSSSDNNVISLFELTPDGKTKLEFEGNYFSGDSTALAPYLTDGKLFIYKQDETGNHHWKITNIEYKPD
ncbi:hypothetical protein KKI93_22305 [Xenorhabdus bovienii]|uniref:hypothetical protein n=1 Tax=Xenorhabdus bovienii TaxID=40576 RepID=UPI0023B21389|nr:hypothetical protein [Xenorhabdus bovienii]MDE9566663.1 hypothetical protein [Xenorhabdus bovienii]